MRYALLLLSATARLAAQVPPTPEWSLSSTPILVIGNEASAETRFDRIGTVARFPDGSIVVADGSSKQLRVFSASGTYQRSLSRDGDGPGELRALHTFFRAGDTLIVSEAQPGEANLHFFTTKGFLSRVTLESSETGGLSALGRFPDGNLLVAPGIGDSKTGAITQYSSARTPIAEIGFPLPTRAFKSEAIAAAKNRLLGQTSSKAERARIEALYAAPRPATAPLFTQFVSGSAGEVWILQYNEDPSAPPSYVVLDQTGRMRGRVVLPVRFNIHEIGSDYVLGVQRDDDGIERVASYALRRR
jgi:hypothetical protein